MDSLLHIEIKKQKLQARKSKNTKSMALRRHCETSHKRQERLQDTALGLKSAMLVCQAVRLQTETLQKRQERLCDLSQVRQDKHTQHTEDKAGQPGPPYYR